MCFRKDSSRMSAGNSRRDSTGGAVVSVDTSQLGGGGGGDKGSGQCQCVCVCVCTTCRYT